MKKDSGKIGLRKIADIVGVSSMSVSCALRNKPGVSQATRARILAVAKQLGYTPDARIENWMAQVRGAKYKDLLPIAWLNTSWEKESWDFPFHAPYIQGARERARELGYQLDEIWCHEPGMTMRRLSKILFQRGIEGVIVPFPARHLRLDWLHLASVAIGEALLAPRLHRVTQDINFNLQLALKSLRRLGYQRIGICLTHSVDTASHNSMRAVARDLYFRASNAERIPPLFHAPFWKKEGNVKERRKQTLAWLRRYKPQVIVCHDNQLMQWTQDAGFRVPEDIGIVHLAVDDDVLDWAGIHSQRHEMGATAIEWLVSLMRNHQYGVPKTPLGILIRGTWQTGCTLAKHPPTIT